ncbi:Formate-dependent nitrite reductase complex subunit NrfG [Pseudomonas sp. THAF187a]|uniref:c-type cytochrome biogenesis protein CcmI n=1 Tax=unclassified Pseudomonas TaxID=196821 RepID=UPI001267A9DE|nr:MULTISPECIES: c-type cytochrome biogenesis protein CcmI [unclassified Pseudomonas]QFT22890.1 Formate-dependent nitrite reductase complex subunit NrfG [Pseudomonas sp. THAF187a]QFT43077.1 Formate-dependent nitrite reductase complex subunit NrfG [Pseudomonas sp. THAF42]
MIDFWLPAGLLLLTALAFLLIPVLRIRKLQAEEDRTALNVTLYQERLQELESQRQAGVLDDAQLEAGRAEAARELLDDTEGVQRRSSVLGGKIPLFAALLVPVLGVGLYLHWGAIDELEQTRLLAAQQPQSIEEMTARLEQAVKEQPQSAEAWYFLGRTYMAQERAGDAAKAFEQAVNLAGRAPELLGQWAQALYFAEGKQWSQRLQALTDEALKGDPQEVTSLGLLGIAAYESQRYADAVRYWERLVAVLPEQDPSRAAIVGGIERAREQMGDAGQASAVAEPGAKVHALEVSVSLSPEVQKNVQPDDAVFVFARALSGPPMPLAVKRLKVSDLPARISLSDVDAMMPELKISRFDQVQLVARVSRAGNATQGEWTGQVGPVANTARETQTLLIDSREGQVQ